METTVAQMTVSTYVLCFFICYSTGGTMETKPAQLPTYMYVLLL